MKPRAALRHLTLDTPVGRLRLLADATGLVSVDFLLAREDDDAPEDSVEDRRPFREAEAALARFFEGKPMPPVPLGARGGTAFQKKVWDAIARIPHGQTRSYGEIAEEIGHRGAARAVGSACGHNPVPLFVPCHRVLAAQGRIGGYGYCGTEMKRKLLRLEGHEE